MQDAGKTTIFGREPVMLMAIVQAGIALAVGFGMPVTTEQTGLILAFVAAVLGYIARSQVTPTETLPEADTVVTIAPASREQIVTDALDQLERASKPGGARRPA